jgi:hypothetical protein
LLSIEISPGPDGSVSFVFRKGEAYAYVDCGPRDTLHVYHDLPGRQKFKAVGLFTTQALLDELAVIEDALK